LAAPKLPCAWAKAGALAAETATVAATMAAAKAMVFMMMVLPEHVWRSVVDHADSIAGAVPVSKNRRKLGF
jgi:hypothetical protein